MTHIPDDLRVEGEVYGNTFRASTGKHGDDKFDSATSRRLATAQIHEHKIQYRLPDGTAVVDADIVVDVILQDCEIVDALFFPETVPTGGTISYTVDVHRSVGGAAFATVLSAVETVDSSSTALLAQEMTIDSTKKDLSRGDALKVIIDAIAGSGTQGQGGCLVIKLREHPAA